MNFLIVGLGNIGVKYENTRHNIGFQLLNYMAAEASVTFSVDRYASIAELKHRGRKLFCIKPSTYMNLSGKAVKYWMTKLNIPVENVLVVVDDIALDFGAIRIKKKGSEAGHNGLLNISESLGHKNYARMRFGVGSDFPKGYQVDYVLGEWTHEQEKALPERLEMMANAVKSYSFIGIDRTMNLFNGK